MSDHESKLEASDAELIGRAQSGDNAAFGELWRRHYRSAARVARQFTSTIDADDLVSEAYARIYQRVLAGGGPTGAFRPYLYTTIRNLASTWGKADHDVNVDLIEEFEDDRIPEDPAAWALDRTLTARAFRTLPDRWQTVLWYTEIEGMDPHEVAPLMGITANGVAALSYRAREGLRAAWLQAHVSDATAAGECQWAIARVGERARNSLTDRERVRLDAHLASCTKCAIIADEVEEVGSHLAMILVPIILGGVVGGLVVSQLATPSAALAAEIVPAVPAAISAAGATATVGASAGVTAGLVGAGATGGALAGVGTWVGGLALIAVVGGTVALGAGSTTAQTSVAASTVPSPPAATAPLTTGAVDSAVGTATGDASDLGNQLASGVDGTTSALGTTVKGVTSGVNGVLNGTVGAVNTTVGSLSPTTAPSGQAAPTGAPLTAVLRLSGTGTPGATVAAQAAGTVWATTTVASDGTWSITIDALPRSAGSVALTENAAGVLGGLLGGILPLQVTTNSLNLPLTLTLLK